MRSTWVIHLSHTQSGLHHLPEHADLVDNVVPVTRRMQLLRQQLVKLLPHRNDTIGHRGDVPLPLLEKGRIRQDQCDLDNVSSRHRIANIVLQLTNRAPCEGGLLISLRCNTES